MTILHNNVIGSICLQNNKYQVILTLLTLLTLLNEMGLLECLPNVVQKVIQLHDQSNNVLIKSYCPIPPLQSPKSSSLQPIVCFTQFCGTLCSKWQTLIIPFIHLSLNKYNLNKYHEGNHWNNCRQALDLGPSWLKISAVAPPTPTPT